MERCARLALPSSILGRAALPIAPMCDEREVMAEIANSIPRSRFATCAAELLLALGIIERGRSFAIMVALGAKRRAFSRVPQDRSAVRGGGWYGRGLDSGALISWIMIKLLNGVFDPPPDRLTIPWGYIVALVAATLASVLVARMRSA